MNDGPEFATPPRLSGGSAFVRYIVGPVAPFAIIGVIIAVLNASGFFSLFSPTPLTSLYAATVLKSHNQSTTQAMEIVVGRDKVAPEMVQSINRSTYISLRDFSIKRIAITCKNRSDADLLRNYVLVTDYLSNMVGHQVPSGRGSMSAGKPDPIIFNDVQIKTLMDIEARITKSCQVTK